MTFIGMSSYPRNTNGSYSTSAIDRVIEKMNLDGLNCYRMTYRSDFSSWKEYIQYYLDHCPHDLIVDYYHLSPNSMTDAQWQESITIGLSIAEEFKEYADRVWLEPCNEQKFIRNGSSKLVEYSQQYIDVIRNAGYQNRIVINVFWEPYITAMAQVSDPLDRFWTGQHIYFWGMDGSPATWQQIWWLDDSGKSGRNALKIMQDAVDAGLKVLNTEIGADAYYGQSHFNSENVKLVTDFMAECETMGVSNSGVWMLYGDQNYDTYKSLGLEFPVTPINIESWYGFAHRLTTYYDFDVFEQSLVKGDKWKFNTVRLTVPFSDQYTGGKTWDETLATTDELIAKAAQHGVKSIIDFHLINQNPPPSPLGTQGFIDLWLDVANRYKNNENVIAYELANEPNNTTAFWTSDAIDNGQRKLEILAEIVDAIRVVDPYKTIVYPPSNYWENVNPVPTNLKRRNIVLSNHPYSYGNKTSWVGGLENIYDYRVSKYETYKDQFDGLWTGEIECHPGGVDPNYQPPPSDLEKQYVVAILNYSIENGYGFNYWKYGLSVDDGQWDQDLIIGETIYEVPDGGEKVSFSYKNEGADDTTLYARKVVVSEREIVIPAGQTVEITLAENEVLVEKS